ncbi:MAG: phosphatidylinositol mannoside acyltransferase [Acidimicrobiaceae bacterium]|nr:phosphatidylinositol mannoside acyltransferase [Acidimicrobiaceae bacterium]HAA66967.1 phosphatidylinositol mannoside acyltransferase [Acidimicrobiaceae bacterium]
MLRAQVATALYKAGAFVARRLPRSVATNAPKVLAYPLALIMKNKRVMVRRHMRRALGSTATKGVLRVATRRAFESYLRYWIESFRLPSQTTHELSDGIQVPDYRHVEEGLRKGKGVILALPHLGGWEWAGFWIAALKKLPITVVVEPIEPPQLFEWFARFRRELGMTVVPLGPAAGTEIAAALKRNEVVCLLSDRDISGGGVKVPFFGELTTLPGGPALMALRTGAPILPTAVYFAAGESHIGVVRPPLDVSRVGPVREDVKRITENLAQELEVLISAEPSQWHLFQPNWPSDTNQGPQ